MPIDDTQRFSIPPVAIIPFVPKRDELLLRTVLAFPKASRSGLDSRMTFLTFSTSELDPETAAMYFMISLDASACVVG